MRGRWNWERYICAHRSAKTITSIRPGQHRVGSVLKQAASGDQEKWAFSGAAIRFEAPQCTHTGNFSNDLTTVALHISTPCTYIHSPALIWGVDPCYFGA